MVVRGTPYQFHVKLFASEGDVEQKAFGRGAELTEPTSFT
jgi:hypothetical protein